MKDSYGSVNCRLFTVEYRQHTINMDFAPFRTQTIQQSVAQYVPRSSTSKGVEEVECMIATDSKT